MRAEGARETRARQEVQPARVTLARQEPELRLKVQRARPQAEGAQTRAARAQWAEAEAEAAWVVVQAITVARASTAWPALGRGAARARALRAVTRAAEVEAGAEAPVAAVVRVALRPRRLARYSVGLLFQTPA